MEAHMNEFDHYNYSQDKYMYSGKSGKGRSKKEASMNTNKHDPSGHTRKTVSKLMNNHHKNAKH
jgi:nuclear protein 1